MDGGGLELECHGCKGLSLTHERLIINLTSMSGAAQPNKPIINLVVLTNLISIPDYVYGGWSGL